MSYGKFAIDILRSDLGFYREIDRAWVVVYRGIDKGPLYLRLAPERKHPNGEPGWMSAGIDMCTLFKNYEEACEAVRQIAYIMKPGTLARVVQLKVKVDVQIELLEDLPIGVLDALAELR